MYDWPWLKEVTALLETGVGDLDPELLSADEAVAAMNLFGRAGRLCSAGLTLCARRGASTDAHFARGVRSPAELVAGATGGSVGEAISILSTGEAMKELGAVEEALRRGELSPAQAGAVTSGAGSDEEAARRLLDAAGKLALPRLKDRAKHEKAARESADDEKRRQERIRRERFLTTRVGADGELRGEFMLPAIEGARLLSAIESEIKVIIEEAARSGENGTRANYAADALAALAMREPGTGVGQTTIVLTVDATAFRRGDTEEGETCVLRGIGPVPVFVAEQILGEATLKVVVRDGIDVRTVCTVGRVIPAAIRTALEVRDPFCVVPGCGASLNLEIDHWQIDVHKNGPTVLWNLCKICRYHHRLRTHRGWRLLGGPGRWRWLAPGAVDDPPGDLGADDAGEGDLTPGRAQAHADEGHSTSGRSEAHADDGAGRRPNATEGPGGAGAGSRRQSSPERLAGGDDGCGWRLFDPGSAGSAA